MRTGEGCWLAAAAAMVACVGSSDPTAVDRAPILNGVPVTDAAALDQPSIAVMLEADTDGDKVLEDIPLASGVLVDHQLVLTAEHVGLGRDLSIVKLQHGR